MKIFIDTSALYALGSLSDEYHSKAKAILKELLKKDREFITSNYILLETISLLQRRQGLGVANRFIEKVSGNVSVLWIDETLHKNAWDYWKKCWQGDLSLVDCSSFVLMHNEGIKEAFTFDKQFKRAGFIMAGMTG